MGREISIKIFKLPSKKVKKMFLDKFMEKDTLNEVRRGTPQNDPFKFQTGNS
jgi:hypothetical protein